MVDIDIVKSEVNEIIEILSHPLKPEDIAVGWNDNLRGRWQNWFSQIKYKLDAGTGLKRTQVNVGYGLGIAGVERGALAERAARIGRLLMDMASQT